MKSLKSTKELVYYDPYTFARQKDGYVDIVFEDEGVITVPKQSAASILALLNNAFKNGVRMAIKSSSINNFKTEEPEFISKQMPQVEPIAINLYTKKK